MLYNFDANAVQPTQPSEPVPEGWYPVVISQEEQKGVKDKPQCWYLAFTMDIIDGPFKGRKLFTNLNLGNDNVQAVEIAHRELSAICHVTGQFVLNEQTGGTAALKGKPFQVKAVVEGTRNAVKGYKDMQGNDPGKHGAQNHAPSAPAPAPMAPPPQQQSPQQAAPTAWGAAPAQPAQTQQFAPPQQQAPQQFAPAPAQAPQPQQFAPPSQAWQGGAVAAPAAAAAAPAVGGWAPATSVAPANAPWGAR